MLDIKSILLEPEPISVYETTLEETAPGSGRYHEVEVLTALPGPYEIHDNVGTVILTADGVRKQANPRLFGAVDARITENSVIQVTGSGPHANKQYRIGALANWRSHIECELEDVNNG